MPAAVALEVSSLKPATIFEVAVVASPRAESLRKVRRVDSDSILFLSGKGFGRGGPRLGGKYNALSDTGPDWWRS